MPIGARTDAPRVHLVTVRAWRHSMLAGAVALIAGLAIHGLAITLRDSGPSFDQYSFSGNGALIVGPLAMLLVIVGVTICILRRAWVGLALVPLAMDAGMFVILGSF
jgi:hypothetical protein